MIFLRIGARTTRIFALMSFNHEKNTSLSRLQFPSGYYGHFRGKTRNDIYSEYRHLAKPTPPRVFFSRLKVSKSNLRAPQA